MSLTQLRCIVHNDLCLAQNDACRTLLRSACLWDDLTQMGAVSRDAAGALLGSPILIALSLFANLGGAASGMIGEKEECD